MAKDYQGPNKTDLSRLSNEKNLNAKRLKIAVIVSRFNGLITGCLLEGALERLSELGVTRSDITTIEVPGAFELPQAANILLQNGNYDAIICLGCVIRGETSHYDYICQSCASGLSTLSLDTGIPIIFGVLTTENLEQAKARCGGEHGHKGRDSAGAAVEMALFAAEQKTAKQEQETLITAVAQRRVVNLKTKNLSGAL